MAGARARPRRASAVGSRLACLVSYRVNNLANVARIGLIDFIKHQSVVIEQFGDALEPVRRADEADAAGALELEHALVEAANAQHVAEELAETGVGEFGRDASERAVGGEDALKGRHEPRRILWEISARTRRARFTAFESGNSLASSDSRTTTLPLEPRRPAYLPRTPPLN